jgi:hypothetical protein
MALNAACCYFPDVIEAPGAKLLGAGLQSRHARRPMDAKAFRFAAISNIQAPDTDSTIVEALI